MNSPGFEYKISSLWNSHLRLDSSSGGFCCQLVLSAWDETTHTSYKFIFLIYCLRGAQNVEPWNLTWILKITIYISSIFHHFFPAFRIFFHPTWISKQIFLPLLFLPGRTLPALKSIPLRPIEFSGRRISSPAKSDHKRHRPRFLREKNSVHWKNDFWKTSSWKFRKYKVGSFTQIFTTKNLSNCEVVSVCLCVCVLTTNRTSSHQGNPVEKNRANSSFSSELGMVFSE